MPIAAKKPGFKQAAAIFLCFLFATAIGMAGYYGAIPFDIRMWMRLGLAALFLLGLFLFPREKPVWQTDLAFLSVIAGIYAAGLIGSRPLEWLHIASNDARGYAAAKFSEVLPIVLFIFLAVIIGGRGLAGLRLKKGRPFLSILCGLGIGVILFAYFLSQGGLQVFQGDNLIKLLPTIGWITAFSLMNSFMEELWFRGLFLSRFEWQFGPQWAFWLSTLTFGFLHAFGSFTGTLGSLLLTIFTLLLGAAFSYLVQRTNNIWGAVVGHFFADFFMLLGFFATQSS